MYDLHEDMIQRMSGKFICPSVKLPLAYYHVSPKPLVKSFVKVICQDSSIYTQFGAIVIRNTDGLLTLSYSV